MGINGARFLQRQENKEGLGAAGRDFGTASASSREDDGVTFLQATVETMLIQALGHQESMGPTTSVSQVVQAAFRKIGFDDAMQRLDGRLPADIAALLRAAAATRTVVAVDQGEASLQKARKLLNMMMLDGWAELDDVLFEFKEFQARNRGEYDQVVADLARLGSQLARLAGEEVSASQGISDADRERKDGEARMQQLSQEFMRKRFEGARELSMRKDDIAAFDFVLNATRCRRSTEQDEKGSSALFEQIPRNTSVAASSPHVQICHGEDTGLELDFGSPEAQARVERMLTPAARFGLREALGQAYAGQLWLIDRSSGPQTAGQAALPAMRSKKTVEAVEPPAQAKVAKIESAKALTKPPHHDTKRQVTAPHPEAQWHHDTKRQVTAPHPEAQRKRCMDGALDCGMLHELMSEQWGQFQDSLDALTQEAAERQATFDTTMMNINDELTVVNDKKTRFMELLSSTISSINADTEEMNERDEQKRALTHEFDKASALYRSKISEVLLSRICAVQKVRNELMTRSALTPPASISDCDFSDWVSKTGECFSTPGKAITCDDNCPNRDPYKCGGRETMKRDVIVLPNENGMRCPTLERQRHCGQQRCPVDCAISVWSGWSKCSKGCEGGLQVRTRSVLTKPRFGGLGCDAVQEARPCNTGSCDHDCTLEDWGTWTPCSTACGGGMMARSRQVLVPIQGRGRCPKADAGERFEERHCNVHDCAGDEICVAQQDLVLLVDASGSLGRDGFHSLRSFAAALASKYVSRYFGQPAAQLAVALFGNGHLVSQPDGTTAITPAIAVQELTDNLDLVHKNILGLEWQNGFTNLAQGLALADTMLSQGGREHARSAILVLSDGKYSFRHQTAEKVQEVKDKNIELFMAPVTEVHGREIEDLKRWASFPWQTSFQQIPGLQALKHNANTFAQRLITQFCPNSFSLSLQRAQDEQKQYMLVRKGGWPNDSCATRSQTAKALALIDDCAVAARETRVQAFAFVTQEAQGTGCYLLQMQVSKEDWISATLNRTDVKCPHGAWEDNELADTYVLNPGIAL